MKKNKKTHPTQSNLKREVVLGDLLYVVREYEDRVCIQPYSKQFTWSWTKETAAFSIIVALLYGERRDLLLEICRLLFFTSGMLLGGVWKLEKEQTAEYLAALWALNQKYSLEQIKAVPISDEENAEIIEQEQTAQEAQEALEQLEPIIVKREEGQAEPSAEHTPVEEQDTPYL